MKKMNLSYYPLLLRCLYIYPRNYCKENAYHQIKQKQQYVDTSSLATLYWVTTKQQQNKCVHYPLKMIHSFSAKLKQQFWNNDRIHNGETYTCEF